MQWLLTVMVALLLVTHGEAQDSEDTTNKFCSAINGKLKELKETTKALCGTNATEPDVVNYHQLVTWTSVSRTQIGYTNFRSTGTLSFEIHSSIPDDALEVLILAYFRAQSSSGRESFFKIYTEGDDGEEYAKYVVMYPSSRSYYYTNTDNLWFPMTSSRRVYLHVPYELGSNIDAYLYVIGYRPAP